MAGLDSYNEHDLSYCLESGAIDMGVMLPERRLSRRPSKQVHRRTWWHWYHGASVVSLGPACIQASIALNHVRN